MSRVVFVLALLGVLAAGGTRAAESELALARVVLSTGGVGYFEYRATVEGDASLALDVPLDQVDDVLKSIVVFDAAGNVGHAELPGREPLEHAFRDLPFGRDALGSPATLLAALQGAEVELAGARTLKGRVMSVVAETVVLLDGQGTTERHRVTLVTDEGLAQAILEDADRVTFVDADLGAKVAAALDAVATHRVRDRRTIRVVLDGEGKREVSVGYVVGVPLWKASYRVVLPDEGQAEGRVQGWAHVENLSGRPWDGIELTLVSGNPVTFRQALYEAYFVARPEVPVEVAGRILPRLDQGTVGLRDVETEGEVQGKRANAESDLSVVLADMVAQEAAAPMMAPAAPAELFAVASSMGGAEAATQVVFHVAGAVTVGDGETLMVPIVQAALPMDRIGLYQPASHARHPVAAVRVTNKDAAALPPGVATLYEKDERGAVVFVGDARFPALPAGEDRMLAYALDQKTIVDREDGFDQVTGRVKAHDGVFEIETIERQTTTYRIAAPANEARRVVIEHPRTPGWDLAKPKADEVELTDTDYRLPVDLAAGKERTIEVVIEHVLWESVAIGDVGTDMIELFAHQDGLEPEARKALAELVELRHGVEDVRNRLARLSAQGERLYQDQARIRENLVRVPEGGDLARQYVAKLTAQEAELGKLDRDWQLAEATLAEAEAALAQAIANLKFD
jgi:hypothetical protein